MVKRLFLTIVLGISLQALMTANVGAFTRIVSGGWGLSHGSVCLDSTWKGLGNCDGCAEIGATLYPYYAQCDCVNPGGQDGGIGQPFGTEGVELSGAEMINADSLTAKGITYSNICWENEEIDAAIAAAAPPVCDDKDNWTVGNCFILGTNVLIQGCGYDVNGGWALIRVITGYCDWNSSASEYDCYETSNVVQAAGTTCPF